MRAVIVSVGDELVSGLTVNTNASWLGQRLIGMGISVRGHVTVGDSVVEIVEAVRGAMAAVGGAGGGGGVVLVSGGLGPTEDDVTRQGVAEALSEELVEDGEAMVFIERWFAEKGRAMSASNRVQAMRPRSAVCIENSAGTAPGLRVEREGEGGHPGVAIYVMPGVPGEMKAMFEKSVRGRIEERMGEGERGVVTTVTKMNTFGMGESVVGEKIKELMVRGGLEGGKVRVGTTVHEGVVSVRIYATGTEAEAAAMTERVRAVVKERLGEMVYGEGEETLQGVLGRMLNEGRLTVAVAESCTGGWLAKMLTDTAGASGYFARGWVTYAEDAKVDELGVPLELIEREGAVSEAVAAEMAGRARKLARVDYALSTTGVAGPGGGTEEKPVGCVWIGLASAEGVVARRFVFPGDREAVRMRAAQMGMAMLRWRLVGVDPA